MISALGWVPRGAADPRPKRYEISPAELKMLQLRAEMEDGASSSAAAGGGGMDVEEKKGSKGKKEKVDVSDLPADLRMDEYSSDEEDGEDGISEANIGHLLVGRQSEMVSEGGMGE